MNGPLPDERRKLIFADVVGAQDEGLSVAAAREAVAARHGVRPEYVRAIEREGIHRGWPPLVE
jgi:hypothetical protein